MNNSVITQRAAELLGGKQTAHFLTSYIAVRTTRTHLLAVGLHIDASTLAEQAGFRIHVFFRRDVFYCLTKYSNQFHGGTVDLFDALRLLREAMLKAPLRDCPVRFQVGAITLVAHSGNVDHDDPRRALTVCLAPPH